MKISGSVYGGEHIAERAEEPPFLDELRGSYEEFRPPFFSMSIWGEMMFGYIMVTTEGIGRMLQSAPNGERRGGNSRYEHALHVPMELLYGTPAAFKMANPYGFWENRIVPRIQRKVDRDMLQASIPHVHWGRGAGEGKDVSRIAEAESYTTLHANGYRAMYPAVRKLTAQEKRDPAP